MIEKTDDPIRDAEKAQEDPRPIIGHCPVCGGEVRGERNGWDADEAFNFDGEYVCWDCLHEYFRDRRIDV